MKVDFRPSLTRYNITSETLLYYVRNEYKVNRCDVYLCVSSEAGYRLSGPELVVPSPSLILILRGALVRHDHQLLL